WEFNQVFPKSGFAQSDVVANPAEFFFIIWPLVNAQAAKQAALAYSFFSVAFENQEKGFFFGHNPARGSRWLFEVKPVFLECCFHVDKCLAPIAAASFWKPRRFLKPAGFFKRYSG